MTGSLFTDVREALETLGSEAGNQDDLTGMEIANDALRSLDTIEIAHEALRVQRDAYKARIERLERDRFVKHGE